MGLIKKEIGPIKLEIFEGLSKSISFTDFCEPAGTMEFKVYDGFLLNDIKLFSFEYNSFKLEAKIRDGMVFVFRNGLYQHSERITDKTGCSFVAIQWDIGSIGCGVVGPSVSGDMNSHMRSIRTPLTYPPSDIVQILRKNNLLSNEMYESINDLYITILDCLHFCEKDVRRYGAEDMFWNKSGDNMVPKREPDITAGIAPFLSIYGFMKNFDVICESIAGGGFLDFYICGQIKNIGIGRIAIEAKKADSSDLIHGISSQLPEYMKRLNTDYGIYLVYWMKSYDYPYPNEDNYAALEAEKLHPVRREKQIRSICFNLSRQKSPSYK